MLVQTYNHLLPNSNGAATVLSSPTTSTYIPDLPCDDFSRTQPPQSAFPRVVSNRRDRRMSFAPYPIAHSMNASGAHSHRPFHKGLPSQHSVSIHSPRPVPIFNPAQAFDNAVASGRVQTSLAYSPGAHGTILGPFDSENVCFPNAILDELTATQMAIMQANNISAQGIAPSLPASSVPIQVRQSQALGINSGFPHIQVPRIPSIPQLPACPPSTSTIDLDAPAKLPNGMPYLPDAIPPETSQLHIKPSGKLVPPSDTFPTPVELLGELSVRDAEAAQRDRRRAERRKAQLNHETEKLGFTPTDP